MTSDNHSTSDRPSGEPVATAKGLRRTRLAWWVGAAIATTIAVAAALTFAPESDVAVSGRTGVGEPAPDVAMTDFDGKRFELADYRGTPLVVNFWASWCPSCVAEMPDFEKVYRAVGGKVEFLGINHSDAPESAEQLAKDTGVTYRLARDQQGEIFQAFGALGMPTTVFIDADGNVIDLVVGQLSDEALMDYIRRSFPGHDLG